MDESPAPERKGLSANWAVREVDHLFSRLGRYTRFVFYSKWSLAVLAIVLVLALVVWPLLLKDKSGVRVSFIGTAEIPKNGGTGASPVMNSPVYEGTDASGQQYHITGKRAIQQSNDLIVVEQVQGQLTTKSNSTIQLTADRADYYQTQNRMELTGNIHVTHSNGYTFETSRATVDTKTMHVIGKEAVSGHGPTGNLLATGFEIIDNGAKVRFGDSGRVNVTIDKTQP